MSNYKNQCEKILLIGQGYDDQINNQIQSLLLGTFGRAPIKLLSVDSFKLIIESCLKYFKHIGSEASLLPTRGLPAFSGNEHECDNTGL